MAIKVVLFLAAILGLTIGVHFLFYKAVIRVFFVTGNHETYVDLNRALNVLKKTKIQILHNEIIELDGLQIMDIRYPGIRGTHEIRGTVKPVRFFPSGI
jgi:hypothetical protein